MEHQTIFFTNDIDKVLDDILSKMSYNKLFILTDVNTHHFVFPDIADNKYLSRANVIRIKAGDINKNIESASYVWKQLADNGATRKSLLINLGGGVVTDLGGFAASTFKRGIRFINIPTTLLGAVDAAIGGKTGINFNSLKNEIGVFNEAVAVIISTKFFKTLQLTEIKSGFAEMLKHGLLSDKATYDKLIAYDFAAPDTDLLLGMLKDSIEVKRHIVSEDPLEKGLRRALNLGHTAGHAFESLALKQGVPVPHGYAVAWGLVVELILSHIELGFDSQILHRLSEFIYDNYGAFHITCEDYDTLINLMQHDKKSSHGEMNFSLLQSIGNVKIDCEIPVETVKNALDIYRDLMHI